MKTTIIEVSQTKQNAYSSTNSVFSQYYRFSNESTERYANEKLKSIVNNFSQNNSMNSYSNNSQYLENSLNSDRDQNSKISMNNSSTSVISISDISDEGSSNISITDQMMKNHTIKQSHDSHSYSQPIISNVNTQGSIEVGQPLDEVNDSKQSLTDCNNEAETFNFDEIYNSGLDPIDYTNDAAETTENTEYLGEVSGLTERHLQIWNKFFENAVKNQSTSVSSKSSRQSKLSQIKRDISSVKSVHSNKALQTIEVKSSYEEQTIAAVRNDANRKVYNNSVYYNTASNNREGSQFTTPRSVWPKPMKDSEYIAIVENFFTEISVNIQYDDQVFLSPLQLISAERLMILSAQKCDTEMMGTLINLGVNPSCVLSEDPDKRAPVHYCVKNDDLQSLSFLYDQGADLEKSDTHGRKPIHISCVFGVIDSLQFLLECAVSVNELDYPSKNTPLHLAARGGKL